MVKVGTSSIGKNERSWTVAPIPSLVLIVGLCFAV